MKKEQRKRAQSFRSFKQFTSEGMLSGYWPEAPRMPVDGEMNDEARALNAGLRMIEEDGQ